MADIELVIKIPEEIYEASQIVDVKYEDTVQIPLEVITNATPLPKGHGRLIDTYAFQKYCFNKNFDERLSEKGLAIINMFLAFQPTIIEADKEESEE